METCLDNSAAESPRESARLWSVGVAAASAALVWAAGQVSPRPLPTVVWAAAFLFLAVESDVRRHLIPNWLTFSTMAGAILLGALTDGLPGFAQALAGLFLGLLCYLPFYAAGVFGAGDAKAMMALGALLGPFGTIGVAVRSLIVAALLGLAWLIWRRELRSFAERWSMIVATTLANRKLNYFPPSEGSAAQTGIPFAVALVLGLAWAWIS